MKNIIIRSSHALMIVALIAVAVFYFIWGKVADFKKEISDIYLAPIVSAEEENKLNISLNIVFNGFDGKQDINFQARVQDGASVFDALKELSLKNNFIFNYKIYEGMGVLVEEINGIKAGSDNNYWLYYINDEMPMVAIDKLIVKEGDKIEFKFEKSTF